jgi:mono/diheme cytochrome c family protein
MKKILLMLVAIVALTLAGVAFLALWPSDDIGAPADKSAALNRADLVARGAYLAKAGDCIACHTPRGSADYAGGRAIETPFGAIMSPNITSSKEHGIGNWSADDFWGALHNGKSKDGRLLYPAFPYTNYTKISRTDADALHAFFQSVPAVSKANLPHRLRFPYDQQIALAAWRALYFRPAVWRDQGDQSIAWNRGAYLVNGLGHCSACHSSRNQLGATEDGLSGGLIPMQGWYAPSLTSGAEAGLGGWESRHIVQLLKTGVAPGASVSGPMAEVVKASLQHLTDEDLGAMAVYLKTLQVAPTTKSEPAPALSPYIAQATEAQLKAGAKLYETHCVDCHQANGSGMAPAYPALAGNRAVMMTQAVNPIRSVLHGGFAPGTAGNPRPYGMPAFGPLLDDAEVAAVVSYVRHAWGNEAPRVSALDINRQRSVPLD